MPRIVQITSDAKDSKYFRQRFGEACQLMQSSNVELGGIARNLFEAEFPIKNNLSGDVCFVVLNVHGEEKTGCFFDMLPNIGLFRATPQILWDGFPQHYLPQTATVNPWRGLKKLLDESKKDSKGRPNDGKPVYVVAAQCYGLQFVRELQRIAGSVPDNVIFHGLSYGSTYSKVVADNALVEAQHLELSMFVETINKRENLK